RPNSPFDYQLPGPQVCARNSTFERSHLVSGPFSNLVAWTGASPSCSSTRRTKLCQPLPPCTSEGGVSNHAPFASSPKPLPGRRAIPTASHLWCFVGDAMVIATMSISDPNTTSFGHQHH
ncbi:unnamed protein product, partial [Ectocarpus sp. 12 AP-2014]